MAIIGFRAFITEQEKKVNQNTLISDINEILVGYFLNNEKWYDNEAKAKYEQRVKQVSPENLERATGHARVMAEQFIRYAKQHGYKMPIKGVYWTARPGIMSDLVGVDVDQKKNPTDTLIKFNGGPSDGWLGLSAKSTKGRGEIGFKNPGVGTVDKVLGTKIGETYKQQLAQAITVLGLPNTDAKRKPFIRADVELKQKTEKLGVLMLAAMRDDLLLRLSKMKPKELFDHLITDWMNADVMYPPYVKITGQGDKPPYTAAVMDPTSNPKLDALATLKLKLERVGNESIGVMADGKKIMKMRFKFESEKLASSVKMSGEAW
jgi:hypothetical protein